MNAAPGRVLVVGGGIFGITAALELRRRGWLVTVLDPGPIPHEGASSTDVSKVVRMDYGSDRFYHELAELALEGWDRWNHDWPVPLYHEDGFLILSPTPMAPGGLGATPPSDWMPTALRDATPSGTSRGIPTAISIRGRAGRRAARSSSDSLHFAELRA